MLDQHRDTRHRLDLLTTLEAAQALSPSVAHPTVRATVSALNALVDSQQLAVRAHASAEIPAPALA
jgi:hypothetical protein